MRGRAQRRRGPARARDWLLAGAGDPARDAQAAAEGSGACGGRRAGARAAARPAASPAAAPRGVWGAWQPGQREGGEARTRGACPDPRSKESEQDGAWPLAGWQQAEGEALAWAYCHDVYSDDEPEHDGVWVPLLAGSSQEEGEARARAACLDPHPEEESEEDPVWPPWSREEGEALRAREAGLDLHSEDCNPSEDEREQDGERALAAWQQAEGEALLRVACLDSNSEDETEDEWEQDGEWVPLRWLAAPPRPRGPPGAHPRAQGRAAAARRRATRLRLCRAGRAPAPTRSGGSELCALCMRA